VLNLYQPYEILFVIQKLAESDSSAKDLLNIQLKSGQNIIWENDSIKIEVNITEALKINTMTRTLSGSGSTSVTFGCMMCLWVYKHCRENCRGAACSSCLSTLKICCDVNCKGRYCGI